MLTLDWDKRQDVDKGKSEDFHTATPEGKKVTRMEQMQKEMDEICQLLSVESKEFSASEFLNKVEKYIVRNERLLYTNITNYIFTLDDQCFGVLLTNIDNVVVYIESAECKIQYSEARSQDNEKLEKTKRTIIKMWDHINLARKQYNLFNTKDDEYKTIVDEKMEMASAKISQELNGQLISLVGIFTALSFLVFGGISSLDNIFAGAKDIPMLKLMIIGILWCFCIMNLVFVFMFFVGKLTRLSIKSTDDVNANLVEKYPLIVWCNYVLVGLFLVLCWYYYIRWCGANCKLNIWIVEHSTVVGVVGMIVIVCLMLYIAVCIYKSNSYRKRERNR